MKTWKKVITTILALGAIGYASSKAQAQEVYGDLKIKGTESLMRAGISKGNWAVKTYSKTNADSTEENGGWVTLSSNVKKDTAGTSITNTSYIRIQDKNQIDDINATRLTLGTEFNGDTKNIHAYAAPLFMYIDNGKVTGNFMMATIAHDKLQIPLLGKNSFKVGMAYEYLADSDDGKAGFAIMKHGQTGVSASKYFGDVVSAAVATRNSGNTAGTIAWTEYNTKKGAITVTGFVAQNPAPVVGTDGLQTLVDVYTIGNPIEIDPYITGTGTKSLDGLAVKLIYKQDKTEKSIRAEIGYRASKEIALAIAKQYTNTGKQPAEIIVTYTGPFTAEGKVNTKGDFSIYGKFKTDFDIGGKK